MDLGCGNGVLGTVAALDNPEAEVTFVDDSALAIDVGPVDLRATVGARPTRRRFVVGQRAVRLGRTERGPDDRLGRTWC